jgi:hypothetical protein
MVGVRGEDCGTLVHTVPVKAYNLLKVCLMALTDRCKVLGRQHTATAGSNLARITYWFRLFCVETTEALRQSDQPHKESSIM